MKNFIYVNGVLIKTSDSYNSTLEYDDHSLTIGYGNSYGSDTEFLDGKLDDIRFYNRALTESEINVLYHEGGW